MNGHGVLPDFEIRECIKSGMITGLDADSDQVQASSFDCTLGDKMWRVDGVFLPKPGEPVIEALGRRQHYPHNVEGPLEVGVTYLALFRENLCLDPLLYGYSNPKSSTGRNDVTVQVIADGVAAFDTIPRGFRGGVFGLITPDSFSEILSPGDSVSQMRLFDHDTRFDDVELMLQYHQPECALLYRDGIPVMGEKLNSQVEGGSLVFRLDLKNGVDGIVGYRARSQGKAIKFSDHGVHDPLDFFEPIYAPASREICIRKGEFVLLWTREHIRVPRHLAAEVKALDGRSGSFFAHKAGFIESGYGFGENGEVHGLPITLEVSAIGRNVILRHGQRICGVKFERMRRMPQSWYKGSYKQARILPKQFKVNP